MQKAKIMIIEGDRRVAGFLALLLQPSYEIQSVCEPGIVWTAIYQFQPDLLVIDMEMPLISSEQFAEAVVNSAQWPSPEILYTTARGTLPYSGLVLEKPFTGACLIARIERLLNQRNARP